jgi:hypothetical protein
MKKICYACGKYRSLYGVGNTAVCSECKGVLQWKIEKARKNKNPANAKHIARKMFNNTNRYQYHLREIPGWLWISTKHIADKEGISVRDLILNALAVEVKKNESDL